MKLLHQILLYTIALSCCTFVSCSDDDDAPAPAEVKIDLESQEVGQQNSELVFHLNANRGWSLRATEGWVDFSAKRGQGDERIVLSIDENLTTQPRTTLVIAENIAGNQADTLQITQAGITEFTENHHYKIPVVFHVIYQDESDPTQNIPYVKLAKVLKQVNERWQNSGVDCNIEFVPARVAPNGKRMAEPGINRVHWNIRDIDHLDFMGYRKNTPERYFKILWDQNRYVNICLYHFSNKDVTGISCFPFTCAPDTLDGIKKIPQGSTIQDVQQPYCLSINSAFVNRDKRGGRMRTEFVGTIAHELGHYFGLYHPFGESPKGRLNWNEDTDWCKDTPTYNRYKYINMVNKFFKDNPEVKDEDLSDEQVEIFLTRKSPIDEQEFKSTNIMDYYYTTKSTFSPDQQKRVRYVLLHSPFIPGPKLTDNTPKAAQRASSQHKIYLQYAQ